MYKCALQAFLGGTNERLFVLIPTLLAEELEIEGRNLTLMLFFGNENLS